MNKFVTGLCQLVQLGSIIGLTVIGLKRNNDCYKAECKLFDEKMEHLNTQLKLIGKDYEIKCLKKELEKVKSQEGEA